MTKRSGVAKLLFDIMHPISTKIYRPSDCFEPIPEHTVYQDTCKRIFYPQVGDEIIRIASEVLDEQSRG